jgi:hypothetical protein
MDLSPCNNYVMTGAYNKSGHVIDINRVDVALVRRWWSASRSRLWNVHVMIGARRRALKQMPLCQGRRDR